MRQTKMAQCSTIADAKNLPMFVRLGVFTRTQSTDALSSHPRQQTSQHTAPQRHPQRPRPKRPHLPQQISPRRSLLRPLPLFQHLPQPSSLLKHPPPVRLQVCFFLLRSIISVIILSTGNIISSSSSPHRQYRHHCRRHYHRLHWNRLHHTTTTYIIQPR